jgi:protein-disulfide isomerase
MNRYLPFALIALVAAVALGSGTAIYRTKHARIEAAAAAAAELASQPTNGKPGAKAPHIRGAAKAAVTIEEFADFQCPPCGTLSGVLKNLEKAYAGKVRMVFRHYPLQNHVHAGPAALAAEAAGLQGKFWEMHDLLYQHRAAWAAAPSLRPFVDSYAQSLGLDLARFANDLEGEQTKARVAADRERADSLGVDRTPSVFINQRPIPFSSFDEAGLRKEIDALLNVQTPQ